MASAAVRLLLAASLTACAAGSSGPQALPVPTFPTPAVEASPAAGPAGGGRTDDCGQLLAVDDLVAVLGLPLGSVTVRSTIGLPEPSVGRTRRLTCRYAGAAGGPVRGSTLLDINVSAYVSAEAARAQWRVNADAEDGGRADLPLGSASGILVDRASEGVLMVVHGAETVTLVLPESTPRPGDRARADALRDLALRVLPAAAVGSPPSPAGPVVAVP